MNYNLVVAIMVDIIMHLFSYSVLQFFLHIAKIVTFSDSTKYSAEICRNISYFIFHGHIKTIIVIMSMKKASERFFSEVFVMMPASMLIEWDRALP